MCNPPFYSDAEEIERSADGKALEPSSVCSGAEVEMITRGGEVEFVKQMILESTDKDVRDRCLSVIYIFCPFIAAECFRICRWFSSMLGKLSSLERIVETLRTHQIDNYALTELVQGQTRRWVLAWSFSDVRLPDVSPLTSSALKVEEVYCLLECRPKSTVYPSRSSSAPQ